VAYVAFPLSAAAVVVSGLASGLHAAAFVEAADVPAAGADSQLVVVLFAFPADVSARGCVVAPPAAVAAFAVPVGACAPTRHHGCFVAAPSESSLYFVAGFHLDYAVLVAGWTGQKVAGPRGGAVEVEVPVVEPGGWAPVERIYWVVVRLGSV